MKKANLPVRAEQWENQRKEKGCVEQKERWRGGVSVYKRGKLREPSKCSV